MQYSWGNMKNWFKKSAQPKTEAPVFVPPPPPAGNIEWEQFKARHPAGTMVIYMGIPMCVTFVGSMYNRSNKAFDWEEGWLVCEYVDKGGVVREWRIGMSVALKAVSLQDHER